MLARLRGHLNYANVVATIALFVALSTGGAYATHLVVNSSDVVDNSLLGADVRGKPGTSTAAAVNGSLTTYDISGQPANAANGTPFVQGSLTTADIADGTLRAADVLDNSLTGADIKDQSGVDTCVSSARIGQVCVRVENFHRTWNDALQHCANLDLRLPTLGEAMELAKTHDIPGVDDPGPGPGGSEGEAFWTSDRHWTGSNFYVDIVDDAGATGLGAVAPELQLETVCVTTPTN